MNQVPEKPTSAVDEKDQVVLEIGGIMTQVSTMGANSSEVPELMGLMEKVRSGGIDPKEALKRASEIFASKQAYH